jgi:lipopolysaccharide cholinephosphotransferase
MNLSTMGQVKHLDTSCLMVPKGEDLRRLQLIILSILDDVTSFCDKNGLSYVLCGGTALGAVRHGGFIPWDDDADISMPRTDYDCFIETFPGLFADKYYCAAPSIDPDKLPTTQIRLKGTVARLPMDAGTPDEECGIFLDVFPIENTYDNVVLRKAHGLVCMAFGLFGSCRRYFRDEHYYLEYAAGDKDFEKAVRAKARIGRLVSFSSVASWNRRVDRWYSRCKNTSSKFVTTPTGMHHFTGEMLPRHVLMQTARVGFEGRSLSVPRGYEEYLTMMYGDWRKVPSEEEIEYHAYIDLQFGDAKPAEVPASGDAG